MHTNQLFNFIILRPRPRTYASTSPLLLLQLHQQQQLLSINIINSTNHHLHHAKLRILLQHLTSHAAYERSGGPPKRPARLSSPPRSALVIVLLLHFPSGDVRRECQPQNMTKNNKLVHSAEGLSLSCEHGIAIAEKVQGNYAVRRSG